MSYQGPILIREPDLRWPLILVAAVITTLLVIVTAGVMQLSLTRPAVSLTAEPRLEGALRPEMPEFEQLREKIVVGEPVAMEATRPPGDLAVEVSATVRNATGRTLNGLEMRGAVLNAQGAALRERTVIVVPTRQTALEPGEAMGVRILLEGVRPEAVRAGVLMEVSGVRFD